MPHAVDRIRERLTDSGVDPDETYDTLTTIAKRNTHRSVAVRVCTLKFRGKVWSNESNGDTVWAVIRSGQVVTVMLRRREQPTHPGALQVNQVYMSLEQALKAR
jgi:hypothetical protein